MNLPERARTFLSLIYPPCCEACGAAVDLPHYLCATCAAGALRIEPPFCQVCSEPFHGQIDGPFTCPNCHGRRLHFQCAVARYRSTGVVRDFIHRFKYFREYHLRHTLAAWAAESLDDPRIAAHPADALVPVPLFRARERHREFNQAAVIARLVAARAHLPVSDCLLRIRNTSSQLTYDRHGRMENLRNAFRMRHSSNVHGLNLVLVDDVLTTGSTLDECARILLQGRAASVRAITVARA